MQSGIAARYGFRASGIMLMLAALVVVAGCSRPVSKHGYERDMVEIGRDVDTTIALLQPERAAGGNDAPASTPVERGRTDDGEGASDRFGSPPSVDELRAIGDELRTEADAVEAVTPPTEVRDAHRSLVTGIRGLATAIDALASELEDASGAGQTLQAWERFPRADTTRKAFRHLGDARIGYAGRNYRVMGQPAP